MFDGQQISRRMTIRSRKKFVAGSHDLQFRAAIYCVVVGRQSHHASLMRATIGLKKEKIKSPNDALKGYLKTWALWNSQNFHGHCPCTPPGGFTVPHMNPPGERAQHANALCVTANGHKTQSFMKNGGQQKCLDKALNVCMCILYINRWIGEYTNR